MLSKKISMLNESLTIAISDKAKQMKADGIDVISFSAGEPDFNTPKAIADAAINSIYKSNKYTPVSGNIEVLKAIQTKLLRDNNLNYETSQIITNVGAKHSLFNVFQAIIDDGDEVIIPSPYWVSYPEIVNFSGGKSVFIQTSMENDFKISPEQLKKVISSKTKALVLNSPSNPTGSVYNKDELLALAEILKGTDILVISDEIYEKLSYNNDFVASASISEDMYKRTITINGLSKCGAITGWRFGYLASPINELNKAIKKLQSQSTSNISSIVQEGAIAALLGQADDDIEKMKNEFIKRRDLSYEMINKIKGLSVNKPSGAFYLFVNCEKINKNSLEFCDEVLQKAKVALVPGIGFGLDGHFRLSFATSSENIINGIQRIENFLNNL